MRSKRVCLSFIAVLLMFCCGCVRETTEGSTHEFKYELWVSVCAVLAGIGLTVFGWLNREGKGWRGWIVIALGVGVTLFLGPSLAISRIVVNDQGFVRGSGFFAKTSLQDVKYSDLSSIKLETRRGRRGRRTDYVICTRKDGTTAEFGVSDALERAAAPYILRGAAASGVQITDQTEH